MNIVLVVVAMQKGTFARPLQNILFAWQLTFIQLLKSFRINEKCIFLIGAEKAFQPEFFLSQHLIWSELNYTWRHADKTLSLLSYALKGLLPQAIASGMKT